MLVPPHALAVHDVHADRLFNVWRHNPGTLDHSAVRRDGHELLLASARPEKRPGILRRLFAARDVSFSIRNPAAWSSAIARSTTFA
jgi:hypothetical protein